MAAPPPDWSELTEHSRGLSRLAASLLSDFHGGEDLAQEAVLRALMAAPSSLKVRNGTAWLRATVRNLAANEWRGRAHRTEREASVARPEAIPSSEEVIERAESSRRVMDALDALPELHARALRDHYIGGLTADQMAVRDGLSVHTVRSRIQRGKAALRDSFESGEEPGAPHWSVALAPLAAPALSTGTGTAAAASVGLVSTLGILTLMKKFAVVIVCAVGGLFVLRALLPETVPSEESTESGAVEIAELAIPVPPLAPQAVAPDATRIEVATSDPLVASDVLSTTVTGTVVDSSEAPIEGVRVTWEGYAIIDRERALLRSAVATTDADGRYSVDLAYEPRSTWRADFRGALFQTNASLASMESERADLPVFEPGAVEAPRVVLQPAGAARGRVIDERGEPIAGALVRLAPEKSDSTYALLPESETSSDADGRFVLGHVALGTLGVALGLDGRTTAFLPAVGFEHNVIADVGDITLHTSKHITGTIVDEDGGPIEAQRVQVGSLEEHRVGTAATTDAAGRFDLALRSNVTQRLEIRRDGYAPIGSMGSEPFEVEPGTKGLRIELKRLPRWTFRVVDSEGEPIERFRLNLVLSGGSEASRKVTSSGGATRQGLHPDGVEARGARAGEDLVRIRAEGYLPFQSDVTPDLGAEHQQTIELSIGAILKGRVMSGGMPLAGATVTALGSRRYGQQEKLSVQSDEAGAYELRGLGPGGVTVTARSHDRKRTLSTVVQIAGDLFVGSSQAPEIMVEDLLLQGGGSIAGTVLVPNGVEPEGLHVYVGKWGDAKLFPILADGSFLITDVDAGSHGVSLTARPGAVDDMPPVPVDVREGEVSHVLLDASQYGVSRLDLTIEVPGYAPEDVNIRVVHGLLDPVGRPTTRRGVLPRCDAEGRITLWPRASGIAHLELHLPDAWTTLLEPEIALTSGSVVSHHVVVALGSLEVELPKGIDLEGGATGQLKLYGPGHHHGLAHWTVRSVDDGGGYLNLIPKDGICTVDPVQAGSFELELEVTNQSWETIYSHRLPVTVQSGVTTRLTFP